LERPCEVNVLVFSRSHVQPSAPRPRGDNDPVVIETEDFDDLLDLIL
jgi:hypothetical protein